MPIGDNYHKMPELLTVREVQGIIRLGYRATLRKIDKELKPTGAVVKVGNRYLVNSWALARILKMSDNCQGCGRPWLTEEE